MKQKENIGTKSVRIKIEEYTKKGVKVYASMKVDSQGKNHVYMVAEKEGKPNKWHIPFSSVSELKTLKKIIEDLEREEKNHKEWLKSQ